MELEGEDGTKIKLDPDTETVFGRGSGFDTKDRTVSRRHILFNTNSQTKPTTSAAVSLEVLGKNPIWVRSKNSSNGGGGGGGERGIRVFRRFERGEVQAGDWLCVCGQNPVWFTVKNRRNENEKVGDCVDASNIDPIKEFGFLLIGHEFDQYPKQRIHDVKDWDWFLEEPRKNDDDDDDDNDDEDEGVLEEKRMRGVGRKRKKAGGNRDDDDDWTSDSAEDKELGTEMRKVCVRSYSTRLKDSHGRSQKNVSRDQSLVQKRIYQAEEEDNEEEEEKGEDDETLGGFIVDDDQVEPEEESELDEEEEEEDYDDDNGDE